MKLIILTGQGMELDLGYSARTDEIETKVTYTQLNLLVINVQQITKHNHWYPGIGNTTNDMHIYCYT